MIRDTGWWGCNALSLAWGQWIGQSSDGYLGLRFSINGETHFGWAHISVVAPPTGTSIAATLLGYAYETTPSKRIRAGQIQSAPELQGLVRLPQSLGLLAAGAMGVDLRRSENDVPGR
jgi:hypothetical protein